MCSRRTWCPYSVSWCQILIFVPLIVQESPASSLDPFSAVSTLCVSSCPGLARSGPLLLDYFPPHHFASFPLLLPRSGEFLICSDFRREAPSLKLSLKGEAKTSFDRLTPFPVRLPCQFERALHPFTFCRNAPRGFSVSPALLPPFPGPDVSI